MEWILTIVVGLVALTVGTAVGYVIRQQQANTQAKEHAADLERIKATTEAHNKELELKAKDDLLKRRDELEVEAARRRSDMDKNEERLQRRREELDRRGGKIKAEQQSSKKNE